MTDLNTNIETEPFGVGKILSESFSLLFGNIVAVAVAAFIPLLIMITLSGMMLGFDITFGAATPDALDPSFVPMMILNTLVSVVIYGIVTAIIVQLAYDAKLG